ncbi:acyltransferase [Apiospora marii]|uniref:Acyltransferase n=1 Tax=Apiospora marii TaxID=335849 RepID=A0ABR1SAX0_9PEZI
MASPIHHIDGLRGYAAFFVVWHHISLIYFSWSLHDGYAGRETDHLLQLPILRLAISGPPHVFIFFVVSGYALSHKTLKLLRATGGNPKTKTEEAYAALASSAFRRHPRLFLPPVVLSLPTVLVAYANGFGGTQEGGGQMPGAAVQAMDPAPLATLTEQFADYVRTALELVDPLAHRDEWTWVYNPAMWTLPHEFRGSLLVYGALLTLSRCKNGVRLLVTVGMASWALYFVYWPQFLFLSGMLLADLRLHSRRRTPEEDEEEKSSTLDGEWKPAATHSNSSWQSAGTHKWSSQYVQAAAQITIYVFVLYVLGAPEWHLGGDKAPGYVWLAQLVPSQYIAANLPGHFWGTIAAVALILVLDRSPLLQRLFTTPLARYLGRISYSLYLVHVPILHGLGWWAGKFFLEYTGSDTNSGYVLGVAGAVAVVWVVTIWAADLGWRYVDAPAVRFAGWVHRRVASGK